MLKKYLGINVKVGSLNIYEIRANIKCLLWIKCKEINVKEIYWDQCRNNN